MAFPILLVLAAAQAASAAKQAQEVRDAAELQQALNEINAKYIDFDAYEAEKFGFTEVARYEPQISGTIGAQKNALAYENVDTSYGTAAEIQRETQVTGTLNILEIQNQARMKAAGLRQQARNMRISGAVAKDQANLNANATETAGYINAGATGYRAYTQMGSDKPTEGKTNKVSTRITSSGWVPMSAQGNSYYKS